jgi:alpha-N-acetylglucosamine transferase
MSAESKPAESKPAESKPAESKPNAFVSLIMFNHSYIYGMMTLAHSLRLIGTKHKIVCMATHDIYDLYKNVLERFYDEVIPIKYIKYANCMLKSGKQETIYGTWKDFACTKWTCLALSQYNKICFLDADLIIIKNIDHLFEIQSPAGCFVNYWAEFKCRINNPYKNIKFGEIIPNNAVKQGLSRGFVINGHCVILNPSKELFAQFSKFMTETFDFNTNCISMVDEQAIVQFMNYIGKPWTQLNHAYNTIPWKITQTNIEIHDGKKRFRPPYILHYFNKGKPWSEKKGGDWQDTKIWWGFWNSIFIDMPELLENEEIIKLTQNMISSTQETCPYCEFININIKIKYTFNINHRMIDGKIVCPRLAQKM